MTAGMILPVVAPSHAMSLFATKPRKKISSLKDVLITVTKCDDGGRMVESIRNDRCDITGGEPASPGSLRVDPHQKNAHGTDATDNRGNEILLTSTNEGKTECMVMLEEKKTMHQDALRKCTDDKSTFEDNKRKAFDLTLNRHCTEVMKNRIEELTNCMHTKDFQ